MIKKLYGLSCVDTLSYGESLAKKKVELSDITYFAAKASSSAKSLSTST